MNEIASERVQGIWRPLSNPSVYSGFQRLLGAKRSRRRLVEEFLKVRPGERVLDVGCGPGDILEYLPTVDYVGIDWSPEYIAMARKRFGDRGRFEVADVGHLKLAEEDKFDIVLGAGLLHHLNDESASALMTRIAAVLNPDGRSIFIDPAWTSDQGVLARMIIANDRGQYVRNAEGYAELASQFFRNVSTHVRHDQLRVPYTHCITICRHNDEVAVHDLPDVLPVGAELPKEAPTALLPPGALLQYIYVEERLTHLKPGRFIEIGVGRGHLSRVLLERGWTGVGYDLSDEAVQATGELNSGYISAGQLRLKRGSWLDDENLEQADLIISRMVIEHLTDEEETAYFDKVGRAMSKNGLGIVIVPGSPNHWGYEDDAVGHQRRYTFDSLRAHIEKSGLTVQHMAGLTYPLSNILLPVSNYLVRRAVGRKIEGATMEQRTEQSGYRRIPWKTELPQRLSFLINETTLYPFHLLQKLFAHNPSSLAIYAEFYRPEDRRFAE